MPLATASSEDQMRIHIVLAIDDERKEHVEQGKQRIGERKRERTEGTKWVYNIAKKTPSTQRQEGRKDPEANSRDRGHDQRNRRRIKDTGREI